MKRNNSQGRIAAWFAIFLFVAAMATTFVGQAAPHDAAALTPDRELSAWLVPSRPLLAQVTASDVTPPAELGTVAPALLGPLQSFLQGQAATHPWIVTVLLIVGCLRFFLKPLVAAAHYYAESTETPKDDELIAKIEDSAPLKIVYFCFDWFASLKLRK